MNNEMYQLLAKYNQHMNEKVYRVALSLPEAEIRKERGAFFGSIFGTLNHIAVGDRIWLSRFSCGDVYFESLREISEMPLPKDLRAELFDSLAELNEHRQKLDQIIIEFVNELKPEMLSSELRYRNTRGTKFNKNFGALVLHLFNHQTHHRGQLTTLLSQIGIDVGVTDLLECIA